MLHAQIRIAEREGTDEADWTHHEWYLDVARGDWSRWKAAIESMPVAATIATACGDVGLIHASPTERG